MACKATDSKIPEITILGCGYLWKGSLFCLSQVNCFPCIDFQCVVVIFVFFFPGHTHTHTHTHTQTHHTQSFLICSLFQWVDNFDFDEVQLIIFPFMSFTFLYFLHHIKYLLTTILWTYSPVFPSRNFIIPVFMVRFMILLELNPRYEVVQWS